MRQDPGLCCRIGGRTTERTKTWGHDVRVWLLTYGGRGDEPLVGLAVREVPEIRSASAVQRSTAASRIRGERAVRVGPSRGRRDPRRARRRQGRAPGCAVADRGRRGAARLLRDDGRVPDDRGPPSLDDLLDRLSRVAPDDREAVRTLSAAVRRAVEEVPVPDDLAVAVTRSLAGLGADAAYAIRSSATAEDLPTASFAGQQDTYLNIMGPAEILSTSAGAGRRSSPNGPSPTASATASTTGRSTRRGGAADGLPAGAPASCSRPTPSPATGKSPP